MDVARLNFSHGSHEEHAETIARIRTAAQETGRTIAILQDLPGPKVRTGAFRDGLDSIVLESGSPFALHCGGRPGDERGVPVTYADLCHDVRAGHMLFLADGAIALRIERVDGPDIHTTVMVGGELRPRQGIAYPDGTLNIGAVTERDFEHLAFGLEAGVDMVAVSFVRDGDDLRRVRTFMLERGPAIPIVAKIERREALEAIDEIVNASDAIMVARGDLGISIPLQDVPHVQKDLIRRANRACRPVITATQMLESMIRNMRPTRAEAADVANAILDGSDAVMLSAETARGDYPGESVRTMARIATSIEADYPYESLGLRPLEAPMPAVGIAIADAAVRIAERLHLDWIVTGTTTGNTARAISAFRPRSRVVALTPRPAVARQMALIWGVEPVIVPEYPTFEALIPLAERHMLETNKSEPGDTIVITSGMPVGAGGTNVLKVHRIS